MATRRVKKQSGGRSGGRAGGAGYDLQDIYVARQLAMFLVGDHRDPPVEVCWEKKAIDTGTRGANAVEVDDAIIHTKGGMWIFVQVKQSCPGNGWSVNSFVRTGVARQFWKQWSSLSSADRPRTHIRLATAGDCQHLALIFDAGRRSRTPSELFIGEASEGVRNDIEVLARSLRIDPHTEDFLAFLKALEVEQLGSAEEQKRLLVQSLAVYGRGHATDLADRLRGLVGSSKHIDRSGRCAFTFDTLVQELFDTGVAHDTLAISGVVRAAGVMDAAFWQKYRARIVANNRRLRLYGLETKEAVYADLPTLFVPLKLSTLAINVEKSQEADEPKPSRRSVEDIVLEQEKRTETDSEENKGEDEPSEKSGVLEMADALAKHRRIALIGGPGTGKTTMLKRWAIVAATEGAEGVQMRRSFGLPAAPMTPLYVRFLEFARHVQQSGMDGLEGKVGLVSRFITAVCTRDFGEACPSKSEALQIADELLTSDKTLLLFDGLDEVPDEATRQRLFDAVADLLTTFRKPFVIVSSRPYAFTKDALPIELPMFAPLPLDRRARRTFAIQWYQSIRPHVAVAMSEQDAMRRADDLFQAAERLPDLAENPLLLSVLALVHFNGNGIPVDRAKLYDHATVAMLGHWDRSRAGRGLGDDAIPADWAATLQLNEGQIRCVVETLAAHVQFQEGGSEVPKAAAIDAIRQAVTDVSGRSDLESRSALLLRLLVERSGLIQERSPGVLAFSHLSFQEYLAGRNLLRMDNSGIQRIVEAAVEERHSEVVRFAVATLASADDPASQGRAQALIQLIGERHAALAAACLLESPAVHLDPTVAEALAQRVYYECSERGRYMHSPRLISRLVWAVMRFVTDTDRLVLEFLASGDEGGHRHPMEHDGAGAILAGRPATRPSAQLEWVLKRLAASKRAEGDHVNLGRVARLILAETKSDPPTTHLPELVQLLRDGKHGNLSYLCGDAIGKRTERLLCLYLRDEQMATPTRSVLLAALTVQDRGYVDSWVAWEAIQLLRLAGEPFRPEFAYGLVRHGLWLDDTKMAASMLIEEYLGDETSREAMVAALHDGLIEAIPKGSDHDAERVRKNQLSCARILQAADAVATADRALVHEVITGGDPSLSALRSAKHGKDAEDERRTILILLADKQTRDQTVETLSHQLHTSNAAQVWRAATLLIEAGATGTLGLVQGLINEGLSSEANRSVANTCLVGLLRDPVLSHATRAALVEGLRGRTNRVVHESRLTREAIRSDSYRRENDAVASGCALVLLSEDKVDDETLLDEIVLASFRDPSQANIATEQILKLMPGEHCKAVTESLGRFFQSEEMNTASASVVARALADAGYLDVPGLGRGLVMGGLSVHANHPRVLESLSRMLNEPRLVTDARKALAEGIEAKDPNTAWGSAKCLCTWTANTDAALPAALIRVGLSNPSRREQARAWLLDMLGKAFLADRVMSAMEEACEYALKGGVRQEDRTLAWEIARCLVSANRFEVEYLADAVVAGGLGERDRHTEVIAVVSPVLRGSGPHSDALRKRLRAALGASRDKTSRDDDIAWGAARCLIECDQVSQAIISRPISSEEAGETEESDETTALIGVLVRECDREPAARVFMMKLATNSKSSDRLRRSLVELLDRDEGRIAYGAACVLVDLGDLEHLALPVAIARWGFGTESTRDQAAEMLERIRAVATMTPAITAALLLSLQADDDQVVGAVAAYIVEKHVPVEAGVIKGLIRGRGWKHPWSLETKHWIQNTLQDPATREGAIAELLVGLCEKEHFPRFGLVAMLVSAGAPLYDKVLRSMADACRWRMPAAPLALLARSERVSEARDAARRLGYQELVDLLGNG